MGKVTITYNGAVISEAEETAPVTVRYHGSTIATLGAGESRTLSCGGKYMRSDLIIGSKTLSCGGKKMASDIGLAAEADKVEDDTITYTGAMTDQIVLMSNVAYRLLTLTSSGTLTISNSRKADVWMCGGGNAGIIGVSYSGPSNGAGGAGGKAKFSSAVLIAADTAVAALIGSGGGRDGQGGQSAFGEIQTDGQAAGPDGGTGGGHGGNGTNTVPGKGDGISKYPFSDQAGAVLRDTGTAVAGMNEPHSAGGGGGQLRDMEDRRTAPGANGGTNGSDSDTSNLSGAGGTKGGGQGGLSGGNGADGSFYGSGGGGGSYYISKTGKETVGAGGSGYQGIIYVRIPLDQSIYN